MAWNAVNLLSSRINLLQVICQMKAVNETACLRSDEIQAVSWACRKVQHAYWWPSYWKASPWSLRHHCWARWSSKILVFIPVLLTQVITDRILSILQIMSTIWFIDYLACRSDQKTMIFTHAAVPALNSCCCSSRFVTVSFIEITTVKAE